MMHARAKLDNLRDIFAIRVVDKERKKKVLKTCYVKKSMERCMDKVF